MLSSESTSETITPVRTPVEARAAHTHAPAADVTTNPLAPRLATNVGTRTGALTSAAYALSDVVAGSLAFGTGALVVSLFTRQTVALADGSLVAACLALQLVGNAAAGLYRAFAQPPAAEFSKLTRVALFSGAALATAQFVAGSPRLEAVLWLAAYLFGSLWLLPLCRGVLRSRCARFAWWGQRTFVVGESAECAAFIEALLRCRHSGLRPIGIFAANDGDESHNDNDSAMQLGPIELMADLARQYRVDCAVLLLSQDDRETANLATQPSNGIRQWLIVPPRTGLPSLWSEASEIAGGPAFVHRSAVLSPLASWMKRAFDVVAIVLIAILLSPMMALIALSIWLCSPGKVLYAHERVGKHGRRFRAWKFRTMHMNADRMLAEHLAGNPALAEEWRATHKLKHDPRVHWLGNFLRKSSLDELPQMWNVLRGEMSLVGPRPIVTEEIEKYGEDYGHYLQVPPGITGLWQVSGRNNTTYDERVAFDAYYVKNWSVWLDLYILACTVRVVLLRDGAY